MLLNSQQGVTKTVAEKEESHPCREKEAGGAAIHVIIFGGYGFGEMPRIHFLDLFSWSEIATHWQRGDVRSSIKRITPGHCFAEITQH